ncbi:hypothetical protein F2Q70_00043466 [Brassica cretica]|uniref:RNase H type-1 domain-containing protein n=1 Tax=Brassica cretica TaxID=69181 RepID=A0A8S9KPP8_BRACR|nr:hypothetical protein F2Q70_00043466 [Brassica cretica]
MVGKRGVEEAIQKGWSGSDEEADLSILDRVARWNRDLLSQTFTPEDVERILKLKPTVAHEDTMVWGFEKNGRGMEEHKPTATPTGFSRTSVFLNLLHLVSMSKNLELEESSRIVFPWVLWHLWKARNGLAFENRVIDPITIARNAFEEASTWITAFSLRQEADLNTSTGDHDGGWVKPPLGFVKCNIGSSWLGSNQISGAAWILRDEKGKTLVHS